MQIELLKPHTHAGIAYPPLAVIALDGQPIGTGRPGPLFGKMYALYQDYKQRVMRTST